MKDVELAQVRAMLREIVATSGNNGNDVEAVMSLGGSVTPEQRATSVELNDMLQVVKEAMPSLHGGMLRLNEKEWRHIEDVYYQRVMQPLFA